MAEIETGRAKRRTPRRRVSAESPPEPANDTPDPIEIAMKAIATGADRHGAAQAVLEKHACLIDIQCRREREELGNVRVQRITRWLILGAVAAVLLAIAATVVAASRSRALVVEPLSVPPALEARGLNGRVLSARLLDKLAAFQRQTESVRASGSYANNWEDEVRVDLAGAGLSLGETWRTLRRMLGEETRISGELTQGPDGQLAITTRAGAESGGSHAGSEAELDALLTNAAEGIYRATQPYRFAVHAGRSGDDRDSNLILEELARGDDRNERMWALNGLSVNSRAAGDPVRAIAFARSALEIDSELVPAMANIASASLVAGHAEAALEWNRRSLAASRSVSADTYDLGVIGTGQLTWERLVAELTGDYWLALAKVRELREFGRGGFDERQQASDFAGLLPMLHQYRQAINAARSGRGTSVADRVGAAMMESYAVLLRALEDGNGPAAESAGAQMMWIADRLAASSPYERQLRSTFYAPAAAVGLAAGRRAAEAEALVGSTPLDCYDCVRARGLVAFHGGDRRAAQRWLREAIRQGPSLPAAYLDLARMLPRDSDAALAQVIEANRRGPGWADPLKMWGDILARRGDVAGAERRYREAAERAPRWGQLHLRWADTLWRTGRRADAQATLQAAKGMDLNPRDRALLDEMIANAGRAS
jgi:tetratricopeptide (TPR) repeat protein